MRAEKKTHQIFRYSSTLLFIYLLNYLINNNNFFCKVEGGASQLVCMCQELVIIK